MYFFLLEKILFLHTEKTKIKTRKEVRFVEK